MVVREAEKGRGGGGGGGVGGGEGGRESRGRSEELLWDVETG